MDIFAKDYIFIPICEKLHWTLAVIDRGKDAWSKSHKGLDMLIESEFIGHANLIEPQFEPARTNIS